MAWLELKLELSAAAVPDVEQRLEDVGALSITLADAADQPLLEPGVGETPLWSDVVLTALFEQGTPREPVRNALHGIGPLRWREFDDQAWERTWLDRFAPERFGDRLWVVPSGYDAPDDGVIIRLDPGLAFGTGQHPTTALCLEHLGSLPDLSGLDVLDFGCGSGILAIAASKLGAARVTALDNDPQALIATRDNVARNNIADGMDVVPAPLAAGQQFHLIVANILAGPLVALAETIKGALAPDGQLLLSGLLAEQADEVCAAYAPTVAFAAPRLRDNWVLLVGRRRS